MTFLNFHHPKCPCLHHKTLFHRKSLCLLRKDPQPLQGCVGVGTGPRPFCPSLFEVLDTWNTNFENIKNVYLSHKIFLFLVSSISHMLDFDKSELLLYIASPRRLNLLEPSCCKKRQKKSQPRNWFEKLGTSEGSEWYQIDPQWLRGSLMLI